MSLVSEARYQGPQHLVLQRLRATTERPSRNHHRLVGLQPTPLSGTHIADVVRDVNEGVVEFRNDFRVDALRDIAVVVDSTKVFENWLCRFETTDANFVSPS